MRSVQKVMRGYTLIEILVVVAIIGVMSLVTVPQFIGYQHSAALKGAMRNFNADIRNCRQLAVSRYVQVRLEFTSANSYSFFYRQPGAATWDPMPQALLIMLRVSGTTGNTKTLKDPMTFTGSDFLDQGGNSQPDIVFNTDGTLTFTSSTTTPKATGSITISSPWKNVYQNRMRITIYATGKIDTVGSKG